MFLHVLHGSTWFYMFLHVFTCVDMFLHVFTQVIIDRIG